MPAVAGPVLAAGGGAAVAVLSPSVNAVLVAALGLVLASAIAVRVRQGRFDPFEPLVVFVIAYAAMFIVRPAAMLLDGGPPTFVRGERSIDIASTFTFMLVLALAGAGAFLGAYASRLGREVARRLPAPVATVDVRASTMVALVFAGLGVVLFVLFVARAGGWSALTIMLGGRSPAYYDLLASSSKYLYFGPWLLVPSALALFALGTRFRRPALKLAAAGVLLVLVFRSGPIGSRITLLPAFGGLLVLVYLMRGRRPGLRLLVPVLALAVCVSALVGMLRNADERQSGAATRVARAIEEPAQLLAPLTTGPDNAMAPAFAAGLTVVPSATGYWNGRAVIGDLLVRPVPRSLWPNKPEPPRLEVVSLLWPEEAAGTRANPEFSVLFLLFMDFGALGVVAGMAALGVVCRVMFEYHRRHDTSLPVQVAYAIGLVFVVVALRDSPVDTATRLAFTIVPAWLIFRPSRRAPVVNRVAGA